MLLEMFDMVNILCLIHFHVFDQMNIQFISVPPPPTHKNETTNTNQKKKLTKQFLSELNGRGQLLLTLLCVDPCLQGLRFAEPRALSQLSSLRLRGGGNPKVFFDVTIGDQSAGRVVMELYGE